MKAAIKAISDLLMRYKRWWIFLILVILLCVIVILFGQSTPLVSFIYTLF